MMLPSIDKIADDASGKDDDHYHYHNDNGDEDYVSSSLPAMTGINDAGRTVTLGGIVMIFCFYRVRASEDRTPPSSRKCPSICVPAE